MILDERTLAVDSVDSDLAFSAVYVRKISNFYVIFARIDLAIIKKACIPFFL